MAAQLPVYSLDIPNPADFSDLPAYRARSVLANRRAVLLTTRRGASDNVMPLGCIRVPEGSATRISCVVSASTHSFAMLLASGECAINVPPRSMADAVAGMGACSGALYDKFALFGLHKAEAGLVDAPVLSQCIAQLECRVSDDRAARRYGLFILEVVRLRVRLAPVAADRAPLPPYSSSSMSQ